jgi:GxxExxY protein
LLSENDISFLVRGACFKIHKALGPGLLESVYESALAHELRKEGCEVKTQVPLPVIYDEIKLDVGFRIDVLINDCVIIEIKSVESLTDLHYKQLLTYLKLSDLKLGLLINFNSVNISKSMFRIVNNLQ